MMPSTQNARNVAKQLTFVFNQFDNLDIDGGCLSLHHPGVFAANNTHGFAKRFVTVKVMIIFVLSYRSII